MSGGPLKTNVSDDLDDASPANIVEMESFAQKLIDAERVNIDALCKALT